MISDVWMQHPAVRLMQHEMFDSLRRWTKMQTADQGVPVEFTIAAMDGAGVDVGLVSAWHGPDGFLISNDEVDGFVRQFPDRLIGVGSVNIARPVEAVREVRRCVRELGFKAIRIIPWLWNLPPNDRRYEPV